MKSETKSSAIKRISRISGQVAGIQRMVEGGRTCNEILQQVTAVRSAMDQLGVLLLTDHLQTCILQQDVSEAGDCCSKVATSDQAGEIKDALTRFLR